MHYDSDYTSTIDNLSIEVMWDSLEDIGGGCQEPIHGKMGLIFDANPINQIDPKIGRTSAKMRTKIMVQG